MLRAVCALSLSLVVTAALLLAAGCGTDIDASEEVDGKPVMVFFSQPG